MAQTQHGTTVTYEIFVAESSLGEVGGSGPVALACYLQQQVEARWVRQVHGGCYVWHRDRFDIKALSSGKTNTGSMKNVGGGGDGDGWIVLGGTSYVGDAMQDEWFIVYLLMRISQHLLPDAIIRVTDEDGQFLLIEAADVIPSWLDPMNAEQRVFLHQGQVHIVPLNQGDEIDLEQGISAIQDASIDTVAEEKVQTCITDRTKCFIQETHDEHRHRAQLAIPEKVAFALYHNPGLVSAAIEAFLDRSANDIKICSTMRHFHPRTNLTTTVRMTKLLYAQLNHEQFYPPKQFSLPLKEKEENGYKLACGFEILLSKVQSRQDSPKETPDLTHSPAWHAFLKRLESFGYFKGEIEGSKTYTLLKQEAKDNFIASHAFIENASSDAPERLTKQAQALASLMDQYETNPPTSPQAFRSIEKPDDTSWLHLDEDTFDAYLAAHPRGAATPADGNGASAMAPEGHDLMALASQFERFIEHTESGLEGVQSTTPRAFEDMFDDAEDDASDDDDDAEADCAEELDFLQGMLNTLEGLKAENFSFLAESLPDNLEARFHDLYRQRKTMPRTSAADSDDEEADDDDDDDDDKLYAHEALPRSSHVPVMAEEAEETDVGGDGAAVSLDALMAMMDAEISETPSLHASFIRTSTETKAAAGQVDVEANLMTHVLASRRAECEATGAKGPMASMLGCLEQLPDVDRILHRIKDDEDSE